MPKNNAVCSICGNEYYMCLSCKDIMALHPYKRYTDTAEHYKVYQIIHGYKNGVYTKAEAKAKFGNVDLSDKSTYREHLIKIIDEILSDNNENNVEPAVNSAEEIVADDISVFNKRIKKTKAEKAGINKV